MLAATLLRTETKQLMGLLSPKSHPRSLHSASVDRAGSLRRTRNSPSNLPFVLAERELSTLLEMGLHPKGSQQRGLRGCKSPEQRPGQSFPRVTPASPPPTPSGAPETSGSPENSNHAASALFNKTRINSPLVSEKTEFTFISNLNQQPDHKNHKDEQGREDNLSQQETLTTVSSNTTRTKTVDEGFNTEDMCVVLEKCTLVPELKAFEQVAVVTSAESDTPHLLKDVVITDLEDDGADQPEKTERVEMTEKLFQREDKEDQVIVWCVTGVCDVGGEQSSTLLEDHNGMSSATDNSSNLQLPHHGSVAPVSSQPLPASRSDNVAPASFLVPKGTSEEDESASKMLNFSQQSKENGKSKRDSRSSLEVPSNNKKASMTATSKDLSASKVRHTKPTSPNTSSPADRLKPVRTLTKSENQGMRRVVPISRTSQSSSISSKVPVRPLQTPIRERPPTVSSLRRSNKALESRDSQVKVSGSRNQNQDFERKPSVRKPLTKPLAQAEEKICRSTLRVLTKGGTVSAPTTPLHKTGSPLAQPGFTRSTASSSFRKTHSTLGSSLCSQTPKANFVRTTPSSPTAATSSGSTRMVPPKLLDPAGSSPTPTLRTNLTIRSSHRSPLHILTPPHQGHRRNNSGSSTHSRDSGKSSRPNWR